MENIKDYLKNNKKIEEIVARKLWYEATMEEEFRDQNYSSLHFYVKRLSKLKEKLFKTERNKNKIAELEEKIEGNKRAIARADIRYNVYTNIRDDEDYLELCQLGVKHNRINELVDLVGKRTKTDLFDETWNIESPELIITLTLEEGKELSIGKEDLEGVKSLESFRKRLCEYSGVDYISVDRIVDTKKKEQEGLISKEDAEMVYFMSGITVDPELNKANLTFNQIIPEVVTTSALKHLEKSNATLKKTL